MSNLKRFALVLAVLVVLVAGFLAATHRASAATVCSPATAISVPYAKDGVGDVCLVATSLCSYINSWNLTTLEVNGTSYLNTYVAASAIAPLNGTYTIHYVSTVSWGHFEIAGTCGGVSPTPTKTVGASNTPVVTGPTATRTRTPTLGTGPTATRTRTPTPPAITPTKTATAPAVVGWPTSQGADQAVTTPIAVSGTFDGGMRRYYGSGALGTGGQDENQKPIFDLAAGATLKNVILGNPAADGVHCAGACTLQNVWWEDVGEDAATFRGSSASLTFLVDGGGARHAADKIFQHNGAGTLTIRNFLAEDFGKLYRSCGNCSTQYQRNVIIQNVTITLPWSAIAGINTNYGDTARFSQIILIGTTSSTHVCNKYTGNNTGAEPPLIGSGADGVNCIYSPSDIIYK